MYIQIATVSNAQDAKDHGVLARAPTNDHQLFFQQLQEKYRCLDCNPQGGTWCWISAWSGFHKSHHARLDSNLLSKWATFMVDRAATIHYPPRVPEFDDLILEPLLKRHLKRDPEGSAFSGQSINPSTSSTSGPGGFMKEVHYHHHNSRKRPNGYSDDDSPESSPDKRKRNRRHKTHRRSRSESESDQDISPDITMSPFAKFCRENDRGYQWENVFQTLQDGDVGMDLIGVKSATTNDKLTRLCPDLKPATAIRLAKYHKKWIDQIKV
jgi:hypothetical protein